jgi:hypothetical protein
MADFYLGLFFAQSINALLQSRVSRLEDAALGAAAANTASLSAAHQKKRSPENGAPLLLEGHPHSHSSLNKKVKLFKLYFKRHSTTFQFKTMIMIGNDYRLSINSHCFVYIFSSKLTNSTRQKHFLR